MVAGLDSRDITGDGGDNALLAAAAQVTVTRAVPTHRPTGLLALTPPFGAGDGCVL
jgi:hypothetical protein